MKSLLSLIISIALVVSGYSQTRNVLVGTNNAVVQPTNFWSADASNARSGLGLGSAATNPATSFQPSSAVLSNVALSNGGELTNLAASNIAGAVTVSRGGTGATNAGGARTNLGLGSTWLTNTNVTNFRTAIGLGTNAQPVFDGASIAGDLFAGSLEVASGSNSTTVTADGIEFTGVVAATTRTNLGLGWPALTNSNSGTGLVSVNTNGEVVSPTNFWQLAPINTRVQNFTNVTVTETNNATNARNLFVFSLATTVSGVTNTIALPTNPVSTFEGDVATVTHLATNTNAMTAIRQLGGTNLITLNRQEETVQFIYRGGQWRLSENISYVEPIYFSGANAAANAAASRTNLFTPNTPIVFSTNGQIIANTGTNVLVFTNRITIVNASTGNPSLVATFGNDYYGSYVEYHQADESLSVGYQAPMGSWGYGEPHFEIKYGSANDEWGVPLLFANTDTNVWQTVSPSASINDTYRFDRSISFDATNIAAATRTNLGLGQTNNVTFSNVTASGTLTATSTVTAKTNLVVEGFVDFTTNRTNATPVTQNTAAAWIQIRVGTNVFYLPAHK